MLSDFVPSLKKVKSKTTQYSASQAYSRRLGDGFPVVLLLQPLRYFPIDKRGISPSIE